MFCSWKSTFFFLLNKHFKNTCVLSVLTLFSENESLLNKLSCEIKWMGCTIVHVAFAVFSSQQYCFVFNIHFELIWFAELRTPRCWMFVWWWDKTDFGKNKKAYRKRSSSETSGKDNFIRLKVKNKEAYWACLIYSVPQTSTWFLNLLFWLRGSSAFF